MTAVVLDTNVIVSGVAAASRRARSLTGAVFQAWRLDRFELVTSRHILDEVSSTLAKPYFVRRLTPRQIARVVDLLEQQSRIVLPDVTVVGVATHPEDDLILATAVAGECEFLVTGDRPLRNVSKYRDISIVTPSEFLEALRIGDRLA